MSELYFCDLFEKDKNNYIYAVDMLRVSCDITNQIFEDKIMSHLKPLMAKKDGFPRCEIFTKYGFGGFKYNYAIRLAEDKVIYIGFMSNQELVCESKSLMNPMTTFNLTIEFNPNKIMDLNFLINLFKHNWGWVIVSCDVCCDLPFPMSELQLLKNPKNLSKVISKNGVDTFELGVGRNRIKIYNKTVESKLDYDLTRVEFSVGLDLPLCNFRNYKFKFKVPKICARSYQVNLNDLTIDSTLQALLFAIEKGYDINKLSRRYREKIIDYEMKKSPIEFDFGSFNKTFYNYISYYFCDLVI